MKLYLVLLKALLPVCMVYTTRGESQVANIARGPFHSLTENIMTHSTRIYIKPISLAELGTGRRHLMDDWLDTFHCTACIVKQYNDQGLSTSGRLIA